MDTPKQSSFLGSLKKGIAKIFTKTPAPENAAPEKAAPKKAAPKKAALKKNSPNEESLLSALKLKDEEIKQITKSAAEAARIKDTFMAKISHDLRSPLNAIIGFAEIMYQEKVGHTSPEHKEYLADILTSSRQLLMLINDVIDLAKVESGKMEFNPEKINIEKIFNETKNIFHHLITEKNIKFETHIDSTLEKIIIDPVRFKQIIYNYVSNALKCTAEGGCVTISIHPEIPGFFRFEVNDTGIGIREEDFSRLFVEFQQIDRNISKQYPSSGLGLALTKHIVAAQGGQVGLTSTFGKGSTFYAVLPSTPIHDDHLEDHSGISN